MQLIYQLFLGKLVGLNFRDELLLPLLLLFDKNFRVVDLVHLPVHFVFIEIVFRWIWVAAHGLAAAIVVSLIPLLNLYYLVGTIQLIFLEEVAPLKPHRIFAELPKHARSATCSISGALDAYFRYWGVWEILRDLFCVGSHELIVVAWVKIVVLWCASSCCFDTTIRRCFKATSAPWLTRACFSLQVSLARQIRLRILEFLLRVGKNMIAPLSLHAIAPTLLPWSQIIYQISLFFTHKFPLPHHSLLCQETSDEGLYFDKALVHLEHEFLLCDFLAIHILHRRQFSCHRAKGRAIRFFNAVQIVIVGALSSLWLHGIRLWHRNLIHQVMRILQL